MNNIGVDLLRISRMEKSLENPRFAARVFSPEELSFLFRDDKAHVPSAAANFAAKEAFSKALGTGVRGFGLTEVSVLRRENGAPYLALSGRAAALADERGLSFSVSLSHEGDVACAVVCAESRRGALPPLDPARMERLVRRFGSDLSGGVPLERELIRSLIPPRDPLSHKGVYGRLLVFAGSPQYRGAAALCTEAALRSGAGVVTLASVPAAVDAVAAKLCEPTFLPLPAEADGSLSPAALLVLREASRRASALLIGCGLGQSRAAADAVAALTSSSSCPLVLDADGLNVLAGRIDILRTAKGRAVLTPHLGEMSRLCGVNVSALQADPVDIASRFARETGAVVVLKDADTVVAVPDGPVFLNTTGNAGMARGGSGDVLAGMIAAFLCQGLSPADAAVCGVFLHGAAGDRAAAHGSVLGMLPHDMIAELPELYRFAGD